MTLVVNLFGGPGVGKSVLARQLSAELDIQGFRTEYIPEYAKELTWGGLQKVFDNQLYIFAKQYNKLTKPLNQVDVIVTDAPLLNSLVYVETEFKLFKPLVLEVFNSLNSMNIVLDRRFEYMNHGRNEDKGAAAKIDLKILNILNSNNIDYYLYKDLNYNIESLIKEIKNTINN